MGASVKAACPRLRKHPMRAHGRVNLALALGLARVGETNNVRAAMRTGGLWPLQRGMVVPVRRRRGLAPRRG